MISDDDFNVSDNTAVTSDCSCSSRPYFLEQQGKRPWGVLTTHAISFSDGIYDASKVNSAIGSFLDAKGFDSKTLLFVEEGGVHLKMELSTLKVPVRSSRLQVDFNASSISPFLGFESIPRPAGYTSSWFRHTGETGSPAALGYKETATANGTGEWILNVAAGDEHTLVQTCIGGERVTGGSGNVCRNTRLWAIGSNEHGQLGTSHSFNTNAANAVPVLVDAAMGFDPVNAISIHAGGRHSAVVDVEGKMWTFGDNTHGQCGNSSIQVNSAGRPLWQPKQLQETAFSGWRLRNVTMALGQSHTLVRAVDINSTGVMWAFGKSWSGLGLPQRVEIQGPRIEGGFSGIFCAGGDHSLFLTADGRLWGMGSNSDGQIGVYDATADTQENQDYAAPLLMGSIRRASGIWEEHDPFEGRQITSVGCGHRHSAVLSRNMLSTFGSNIHGQLLQESNAGLSNPSVPDGNKWPTVQENIFLGDDAAVSPQLVTGVWLSARATFVQTLRQPCTPGHSSPDGHQPCFQCESGKFEPDSTSRGCKLCSLGKYSHGR